MNKSKQIDSLTIFRFISAFYVFIFHCNIRFPSELPKWIGKIISNGAIGMTFFFVLSGFVLAISSRDGIRDNYFSSRVKRIYPAYFFMGFLTIPFLTEHSIKESILFVLLFISTTQSLFTESFYFWNFGGSWSVSTEMFFYLLFPFIFKFIKEKPLRFLVAACVISSLIMPIASMLYRSNFMSLVYTGPLYRIPEFICGVAMGCLYNNEFRIKKYGFVLFLISIAALMFISSNHNKYYTSNNYITVPCTCILIYLTSQIKTKKSFITGIFTYLGKISYSFYLMQIPVMMFIDIHLKNTNYLSWWMAWLVIFSVTLSLAAFCYHAVECKGLRLKVDGRIFSK